MTLCQMLHLDLFTFAIFIPNEEVATITTAHYELGTRSEEIHTFYGLPISALKSHI